MLGFVWNNLAEQSVASFISWFYFFQRIRQFLMAEKSLQKREWVANWFHINFEQSTSTVPFLVSVHELTKNWLDLQRFHFYISFNVSSLDPYIKDAVPMVSITHWWDSLHGFFNFSSSFHLYLFWWLSQYKVFWLSRFYMGSNNLFFFSHLWLHNGHLSATFTFTTWVCPVPFYGGFLVPSRPGWTVWVHERSR